MPIITGKHIILCYLFHHLTPHDFCLISKYYNSSIISPNSCLCLPPVASRVNINLSTIFTLQTNNNGRQPAFCEALAKFPELIHNLKFNDGSSTPACVHKWFISGTVSCSLVIVDFCCKVYLVWAPSTVNQTLRHTHFAYIRTCWLTNHIGRVLLTF